VDEALDQFSWMAFDEAPLPVIKLDLPQVFRARADLRENARPVFPVAIDLMATDALDETYAIAADLLHRRPAGLDEPGIAAVLGDSELPYTAVHPGDDAVSEVEAEQIDVRGAEAAIIDA